MTAAGQPATEQAPLTNECTVWQSFLIDSSFLRVFLSATDVGVKLSAHHRASIPHQPVLVYICISEIQGTET